MADNIKLFARAIRQNPRFSQEEKRKRIDKLDRMYPGHVEQAERSE